MHLADAFNVPRELEPERDWDLANVSIRKARHNSLAALIFGVVSHLVAKRGREDLPVCGDPREEWHTSIEPGLCVNLEAAGELVLHYVRDASIRHQD